jgi:hypothetical protein
VLLGLTLAGMEDVCEVGTSERFGSVLLRVLAFGRVAL